MMKAALQDKTEHKLAKERKIPVHVRFVPRDVWIRMHVDVRSTIGAVKDAALDKVGIPPMDPTIFPDFYENARGAMAKPAYRSLEAKTFPKAFIARRPKGTLGEVLESDRRKKGSSQSMNAAQPPLSPSKLRARRKNMAQVSKQLLGGDAGEGGMGSLGSVGALRAGQVAQQRSNDSLSGDAGRTANSSRVISSPSASSTSSRFINTVKATRGPTSRASMVSLSAAVKAVQKTTSTKDLQREAADAPGVETYGEYLIAGLPGNIEAKRREEEAMSSLQRAGSTSSASFSPHRAHFKPINRHKITTSSSGSHSVASSINDAVNATEPTDLDIDDSSSEDDNDSEHSAGNDKMVPSAKNLMSSESDLSSASHLERQSSPLASPLAGKAKLRTYAEEASAATTSAVKVGTTERGRSGTIVGGQDSRKGKLPIDMVRAYSDQSAQSATYATKSSPTKVDASSSAVSRRSQEMSAKPLQGLPMSRMNNWTDNRLAGIRMDEISSWRDARHAMSQHFLAYSFSNGHMLEDWRTVAAFRIRPFELIEIHYANPYDRVFIPREDLKADESLMRSSSATLIDRHLETERVDPYTEQRSEAWCYIFKPGSGPGKAQRAGLGVWKLRFVVVRDQHMYICRKKPSRSAMSHLHDAEVWPLDMLDSVFTERADGGTRPALPSMQGECRDVLTLTVATAVLPDASAYDNLASASPSYLASLSIRFISQADCRAFYNTLARALHCATTASQGGKSAWVNEWRKKVVTRATIAGMGGAVLPGKQGRGKGRNAPARSRLRPPGVSRAFDDVDRWSSQSESEEHDKVRPTNAFNYSDPYKKSGEADATLDPSYDFVPLVKTVSIGSNLTPGSPKMARSSLSPAAENEEARDDDSKRILATTTTMTTATSALPSTAGIPQSEGGSARTKAERTLKGFSIARAARRAVTPTNVSPKTSTAPSVAIEHSQLAQQQQQKGEQASTMGRSTRRRTVTQLDVSKQAPISRSNPSSPKSRATFYYLDDRPATASMTPPRTPVRTSSQAFGPSSHATSSTSHANGGSGGGGSASRPTTSPESLKGSRPRSHTVAQASPPSSSFASSSSQFVRRSVGSKQAIFASPSSSSRADSSAGNSPAPLFHWPFRGASSRASIAARSNLNK